MSFIQSAIQIVFLFMFISGQKDVLKKRLKGYFKRKYISRPGIAGQKQLHYGYYVVIDFEATCDEKSHNYPHEIIEFPAVLVNAASGSVVGILLFSFISFSVSLHVSVRYDLSALSWLLGKASCLKNLARESSDKGYWKTVVATENLHVKENWN